MMNKWYIFHPAVWRGPATMELLQLIRPRGEIGAAPRYDYPEGEKRPGRPPSWFRSRIKASWASNYWVSFINLRTVRDVRAAIKFEKAAKEFCAHFSVEYMP